MVDPAIPKTATVDDGDGGPPEEELPFSCCLPRGLSQAWPAPRRAVLGTRRGALAWIEYAAVRAVLESLSRAPHFLRAGIVGALARAAKAVDRRRSSSARAFLRQALGSTMSERELESRVLQAWRHLLHVTLDGESLHWRFPEERILERFEISMCDEARRVRESGTGSILATAHIGDWEIGSAALPWLGFDPLYGVTKPPKNRPLSVHMNRIREMRGVRLLARRGAMRDAAAVVRSGGMFAMLLDQRARVRPVLAPFFGRAARCDRSAAVLLKRLRAPILIGACYREPEPWRWRLTIPTVLRPEDLEGRSVEEITARINREFEALILAAPEQYFWLHDRYRDT